MLFRTSLATAFLWLFVLVETRAQTGIVFSMTNTWRYEQTTNFDGVAWFSPSFNDSTWPSGRALLYVENNTAVSPRNTLLILGRTTYYFRTRFQFTNSVAGIGLVFSNRVDDGAVFHLNGTEIQRLRMPAAPQPITYATGATGGQPPTDDAISNEVFMISGDVLTNLVVGTNTLAVEVHQIGSSSDIVFGAALSFIRSTGSFTFTQEPVGTNILDGRPLSLTVATSITPPPALQWFKDGQLVAGATLSTLTFPGVSSDDSGTYWVVASNSTMMLTTRLATVVVEPDMVAPVLLKAIAQKNLTNIVIEISEPVSPTATNVANYQLFAADGSSAGPQIIAASVSNATTIHLTTTPRTDRVNYELQLTGIIDLSSLSNAVSSSPVPLRYVFEMIRLDTNTLWRFDQLGMGVPAGWQDRTFDDSDWAEGRSLFYERFGGASPFGPIGTRLQTTNLLGSGPVITYYFRTTAELPGFSSNAFALRHIIDDGAALYMNGEQFYTVRVTPPLNHLSLAAPNGGTPFFEPPTNQPALLFPYLARPGRNFIAAEVHQSGTNWGGDAAFALSIEALIDEFAPELMLDIPSLATNGSVLPMAGNISISKPLSTELVIGLTSSPPNIVSMPATVTMAVGETNATFDVAALATAGSTGPRHVEIHAFAPSFVPADRLITVIDQVPLNIAVTLPAILTESSISPTGQITFDAPLATDLTVRLTTSDRRTLYVPPAVTMPAGQTSVVFSTILSSNIVLDGTRVVVVTAHVAGWSDGTAMVQVLDVPDSYRALPLSTRDIAYDPVTARIYASVPGSSTSNAHRIVAIDPLTRAVEPGLAVGGEPGKLIVPPGGGLLYAAVETNRVMRRIDLQSGAVELSFALETNASNLTVADYELLPGSGAMAVLRLQNGFNADLAIYDEGIRRPNVGSAGGDTYQETIEASVDGSSVYFQSFGYQGLRRFVVNPQGLTPAYTNTTITPPPYSRDWKAAGDRFFGNDGMVINPVTPQVISTIPNVPANSALTYDSAINRVFYLLISGETAILRAYEADSLIPAGELILTGVSGTPSSLVRWGPNGLAFRTDANQLLLINTSLIPTNPPADIAVSLALTPPPYFVGNEITTTLVITNHGPNPAGVALWTNTLPAGAVVSSAQASAGDVIVEGHVVRGAIAGLGTQGSVTATITFRPTSPNVFPIIGTVASSSRDAALANNSAVSPVWIRNPEPSNNEVLDLAVKDIARDPIRSRLYFSIGSSPGFFRNSILVMDYETGTLTPLVMQGGPGRLAISANGEFLYVGLDDVGSVRRLNLDSLSVSLDFALSGGSGVSHMAVCPTNSHLVVITRALDWRVTAYEDAIQRPNELTGYVGLLAFSDTTGELYTCYPAFSGVPLYRVDSGPSGLTIIDEQPAKHSTTAEMKIQGGTLYYNNGWIVDPQARRVLATLPIAFNSLVEPDFKAKRIYVLTAPNGVAGWALRVFDAEQFIEVGYYFATLNSPSNLLRWGDDGLVFRTANQVHLLRSILVPTNPPTDLALQAAVSAIKAPVGSIMTYQLSVTNLGTNTAFSVVVTQAFSLAVTGLTLTAESGGVTNADNFLTWELPPLAAGAGSVLHVSVHALQAGTLVSRSAVRHSGSDPRLNNNLNLSVTQVGDSSTDEIREIALMTQALVFDTLRQKIYASIHAREPYFGNSIIAIDPVTMQFEPLAFAGSEPNQLAISEDGQFLYISLNGAMGARRIDLSGQQPPLSFPFSTNTLFNAVDLKVQPGHPSTLAASLVDRRSSGIYPAGVFVFDDGAVRSNAAGVTKSIEFSPDGQHIFGSITIGAGFGFLRLAVTASGVSEIDRTGAFYDDYDLKLENNLLYSALGRVIDPTFPAVIATFGVNGPIEPDSPLGRIFQIPLSDTTTELRAYAMSSYQLLGTVPLPTARPYARHLIRCGGNHLAFRTDVGGQLFLLTTALAEGTTAPTADLEITQVATSLANPGELTFSLNVDNHGPNQAEEIRLRGLLPHPAANFRVQASQGGCNLSNGVMDCTLSALPAGGRWVIELTATLTNSGQFSNLVSVTAQSLDLIPSNNVSSVSAEGYYRQPTNSLRRFNVAARDLAFDAVRRRLFASVQETPNQQRLVWMDPDTGMPGGAVGLALRPDRLAVSGDNQHLYVTGLNTSLIQRVHLPSLTVDLNFHLPVDSQPLALRVLPAQSTNCIIAYSHANFPAVGLFKDGVLRPATVGGSFRLLAITPDGSTLYGYDPGGGGGNSPDLFRLSVNDDGIAQLAAGPSDFPSFSHDMEFSLGRLYMGQGTVIDASTWAEEASFPALNFEQQVEVDEPAARVILLAPSTLGIYNQFSRQELTRFNFGGVIGALTALTRCGADRLAFLSANELFIVRNNALVAADLTLSAYGFPITATAGSNFAVTVAVLNRGPAVASGVIVTNIIPDQSQLVSAFSSQGSIVSSGNNVILNLNSLNSGSAATLVVRLNPTNHQDVVLSNVATVVATTGDPQPADNRITTLVLGFADNDQDRMADSWEMIFFNGTNALNGGALNDYDQDGVSNLIEYRQGTDPGGPNSLRVRPVALSATEAILYFHGQIGIQYQVEGSPTVHGPWTGIGPVLTGHGFGITTTNTMFSFPSRFYRIRQKP